MGILKKLAGDAVMYGIPSIVGRLLYYFLSIIHTRVFVQQELLAENAQLYAWLIPLQIVFTFGMETAFFRYGSKAENREKAFDQILSFILIFGGGITLLIFIFSKQLGYFLGFAGIENMVKMVALILFIDAICAIGFVKIRIKQEARRFAFIRMSNILLNIGFNLFFFLICLPAVLKNPTSVFAVFYNPANGPDYIIWANYLASIATLLFLWKEFVGFKFRAIWTELKPIIVYAYPLMLMGLAGSINLTADRLLIRSFLPAGFYPAIGTTDQAFSVYAQVYKLSIFMGLVVQAYRYAADPIFFSKMGDKNSPRLIGFSTEWFTIACIVLWMGVSLNLNWIPKMLGKTYRHELQIVPIFLLANLFIGLYGNVSIWIKLKDKTQYGTYITLSAMVLTVVLNIIFIPKFGFMACALTFAFSSILMVSLCLYFGHKYYPIKYDYRSIVTYLVGAGMVIYFGYGINFQSVWLSIFYKNAIFVLSVAAILWHQFKIKKVDFKQKF